MYFSRFALNKVAQTFHIFAQTLPGLYRHVQISGYMFDVAKFRKEG